MPNRIIMQFSVFLCVNATTIQIISFQSYPSTSFIDFTILPLSNSNNNSEYKFFYLLNDDFLSFCSIKNEITANKK